MVADHRCVADAGVAVAEAVDFAVEADAVVRPSSDLLGVRVVSEVTSGVDSIEVVAAEAAVVVEEIGEAEQVDVTFNFSLYI